MSAPPTSKSTTDPLAPGVRFHDNATTTTTVSTETTVPDVPGVKIPNYLINVLAYVCNFLVVFLYTKTGLPDNGTLSNKYQTLVTPAPYAFAIWGIIFSAELVWTVAQCFEPYRSHPLVINAVGYQFVFASIAQCAWTFAFGLEKLGLSLVCMVCILIPLLTIVSKISAKSSPSTTTTKLEYWLLKFPFEMHASWIMAATLINVNVIAVGSETSEAIQTTIGWLSLVVLFGVGVFAVIPKQHYKRVWVVPCVLAWASYAISKELSSPRDKIIETFSLATIVRTAFASKIVAYLLILLVLVELTRSKFFSSEIEGESDVVEGEGPGNDGNGEYSSLNN